MHSTHIFYAASVMAITASLFAPSVTAQEQNTFTNTGSIAIPGTGTFGAGNPYPSPIVVTGLEPGITNVEVTLLGLSHTYPSDLNFVLVGPGGETSYLMARGVCTPPDFTNQDFTFDDAAAAPLPASACTGGTYQVSIGSSVAPVLTPPAPAGPYGTSLAAFTGTDPNGTWELYSWDNSGINSGNLAGGWELTLNTPSPAAPPTAAPAEAIPTMSAYALVMTMLGVMLVTARRLRASSRRD
jgi:hypothetical protein